ncbi:quinone oxidoreductase family protein [Novosphingobium sp.]|uniref:quinone oxidoreductase family protein n=1 Tax=Novosphingobium sp. TaxID=1874826 RepID=UPI003D11017A
MTHPYAIIMHEHGGPDVLTVEPFEPAQPGPGQVLVRQTAIGLNFIDTYVRSGLYPGKLPQGLGGEAAGVVDAIGKGVDVFKVGDRVGYCTLGPGSYATHRLADQDKLVPIPADISDEQAAAALLKGCTAEYLIERCAHVKPGQSVLVHAAAGGVGTILVQWLKAIGATVIAHAGNAQKAALATELGADHALSCPIDELGDAVKALTDGAGVPVVLDGVGAASWSASLACVARRGLIVSYGNASGAVPPFTALQLMQHGSIFVTRPTLGDYCHDAAELRASAARMFAMIASGAVTLRIDQRFKLTDAAEAHRALESRATTGASVLIP